MLSNKTNKKENTTKVESNSKFMKFDANDVIISHTLKTNLLFELQEGEIKLNNLSVPVYLLKLKNFKISCGKFNRIIEELKKIQLRDDYTKVSKMFVDKLGYFYNPDSFILTFVYKKLDFQLLDLNHFIRERLTHFQLKEHVIKLEIIRSIIKTSLSLQQLNMRLSLVHPDLIFYSSDKGFIYLDFIFNLILRVLYEDNFTKSRDKYLLIDKPKNILPLNLLNYFCIFENTQVENLFNAKENFDVDPILILKIYLFSNKFKSDYNLQISFDKILLNFRKDCFIDKSKFNNFLSTIYLKSQLKDSNIILNEIDKIISLGDLITEFVFKHLSKNLSKSGLVKLEQVNKNFVALVDRIYLNYLECSDCKNIINKEDIVKEGNKSSSVENNLDESYIYSSNQNGKRLVFNKTCFKLLCDNCFYTHKCQFTSKYNTKSINKILKEKERQIQNLKLRISSASINSTESSKIEDVSQLFSESIEQFNKIKFATLKREQDTSSFLNVSKSHLSSLIFKIQKEISIDIEHLDKLILNDSLTEEEKSKKYKEMESHVQVKLAELKSLIQTQNRINEHIQTRTNSFSYFYKLRLKVKETIQDLQNKKHSLTHYNQENINLLNLFFEEHKLNGGIFSHETNSTNHKEQYVAAIDLKSGVINLMNSNFKKPKLIFPSNLTISSNCRWLNLKSGLFVCGGEEKSQTSSCFYMKYESPSKEECKMLVNDKYHHVEKRKVDKLPSLLYEHIKPSLIAHNESVISVAGENTNKCEIYNFLTNKWTPLPSLNNTKFGGNLLLYNNFDLFYIFGLTKEDEYCDKIEKLSLFSVNSEWMEIKYILGNDLKSQSISFRLCYFSHVKKSDTSVIIIGGKFADEQGFSKSCFKFSFKTNTLSDEKEILYQGLTFVENQFVHMKDNNYHVFSSDMSYAKIIIN